MEAYEESGMLEEDNVSQSIFAVGVWWVGWIVRLGWLSAEDMESDSTYCSSPLGQGGVGVCSW